jgi:hypothetical protein
VSHYTVHTAGALDCSVWADWLQTAAQRPALIRHPTGTFMTLDSGQRHDRYM